MTVARVVCVVLIPALLALFAGCDQPPARVEPPPPKVSVAHPEIRELVDSDTYNGWLESPETVEVRARVRGHIDKVNFTDGQVVKKGDLLFELDPRPFQAEVDRAKEQVRIYEAQLIAADKEEMRQKELVTQGAASQAQVEKAEADAGSLKAEIEAQKQEILRRQLELDYARILAPIGGQIGRAMMTAGNLVNAGGSDPLLTTIVAVDPMYIYFHVDERTLQRYFKSGVAKAGRTLKEATMPFNFGLETDDGYPHQGVLDFADNKVDSTTGTILVRGRTDNSKRTLVPGSRVKIRVPVSESRSVVLVPDTAILSDQDKKYVLVIDDKNIVHRRDISPGRLLDDGMRVVLPAIASPSPGTPGEKPLSPSPGTLGEGRGEGLGPNDWIVVHGLQSARVNYPVDPIKPTTQGEK